MNFLSLNPCKMTLFSNLYTFILSKILSLSTPSPITFNCQSGHFKLTYLKISIKSTYPFSLESLPIVTILLLSFLRLLSGILSRAFGIYIHLHLLL